MAHSQGMKSNSCRAKNEKVDESLGKAKQKDHLSLKAKVVNQDDEEEVIYCYNVIVVGIDF